MWYQIELTCDRATKKNPWKKKKKSSTTETFSKISVKSVKNCSSFKPLRISCEIQKYSATSGYFDF